MKKRIYYSICTVVLSVLIVSMLMVYGVFYSYFENRINVNESMNNITVEIILPVLLIVAIDLFVAFMLASRLTKKVIEPLNELDLNNPLSNSDYEEMLPLLRRIDEQQKRLKLQSEQLKRRRDEFNAVTLSMNEGLVLLNDKGTILSINPAASNILDAKEDCVGMNILEINRSTILQELIKNAMEGSRMEGIIENIDGEYQIDVSPVISQGIISGAVILIFDVTEKEKAEQVRREFTANVSHELKTPLQSILGYAELLKYNLAKEEDISNFSKKICSETKRMMHLVEDIINLSVLDEGATGMLRADVDAYAIANEVVMNLTSSAELAGVKLEIMGEHIIVNGIPQLISGIVFNLCDNAIKYNKKGGRVAVSITDNKDYVILSVKDTGIGIPQEHLDRIFERFYRVDKSHSKEVGGTGLGLSIVKHSAKLHNAQIEIDSRVSEGTAIKVLFPKKSTV